MKPKNTLKIAFFGDAFCRRSRPHTPVRTFVDLVCLHYGQDITIVSEGRQGGTDLKQTLRDMEHVWSQTGWDLAWVFYEPLWPADLDDRIYLAQQQRIIDWSLAHPKAKIIHCRDGERRCQDFKDLEQDTVLLNLTKWTAQWRYGVTYDDSDNAVDQAGNWFAAERIIARIDQLRQR